MSTVNARVPKLIQRPQGTKIPGLHRSSPFYDGNASGWAPNSLVYHVFFMVYHHVPLKLNGRYPLCLNSVIMLFWASHKDTLEATKHWTYCRCWQHIVWNEVDSFPVLEVGEDKSHDQHLSQSERTGTENTSPEHKTQQIILYICICIHIYIYSLLRKSHLFGIPEFWERVSWDLPDRLDAHAHSRPASKVMLKPNSRHVWICRYGMIWSLSTNDSWLKLLINKTRVYKCCTPSGPAVIFRRLRTYKVFLRPTYRNTWPSGKASWLRYLTTSDGRCHWWGAELWDVERSHGKPFPVQDWREEKRKPNPQSLLNTSYNPVRTCGAA